MAESNNVEVSGGNVEKNDSKEKGDGSEKPELAKLIDYLANLTQTDSETVLISALVMLMSKYKIDFENKFIFGVYVAESEDVLIKEDDGEKIYFAEILNKTFSLKDMGIEIRRLQDAIKLAMTWMDVSGRIAIVYNDGKCFRVLHEAYDMIRDVGLIARVEKLYEKRPPHG